MKLAFLLLLPIVTADLYKETQNFQYSRSDSDDGEKKGFYEAQSGNMGGNYELSRNMDNLAQNQMKQLIVQVGSQLGIDPHRIGTGTPSNVGSVYGSASTSGKSYGSLGEHAVGTHGSSQNRHSGVESMDTQRREQSSNFGRQTSGQRFSTQSGSNYEDTQQATYGGSGRTSGLYSQGGLRQTGNRGTTGTRYVSGSSQYHTASNTGGYEAVDDNHGDSNLYTGTNYQRVYVPTARVNEETDDSQTAGSSYSGNTYKHETSGYQTQSGYNSQRNTGGVRIVRPVYVVPASEHASTHREFASENSQTSNVNLRPVQTSPRFEKQTDTSSYNRESATTFGNSQTGSGGVNLRPVQPSHQQAGHSSYDSQKSLSASTVYHPVYVQPSSTHTESVNEETHRSTSGTVVQPVYVQPGSTVKLTARPNQVVPIRVPVQVPRVPVRPVYVENTDHSSASNLQTTSNIHSDSLVNQPTSSAHVAEIGKNVNVDGGTRDSSNKAYQSSYSYRKEWENHGGTSGSTYARPEISIPDSTVNLGEIAKNRNQLLTVATELDSGAQGSTVYNGGSRVASTGRRYETTNTHQSRGETQSTGYKTDSSRHTAGQTYDASAGSLIGSNIDGYGGGGTVVATKPKSYQSSYSYQKSWERHGTPYVIEPNGQTSVAAGALTNANHQSHGGMSHGESSSYSSGRTHSSTSQRRGDYGNAYGSGQQVTGTSAGDMSANMATLQERLKSQMNQMCPDCGNAKTKGYSASYSYSSQRSYGDNTQNDQQHRYKRHAPYPYSFDEDYLGQQTEDFGQQTEDFGQQTEDLGQQTYDMGKLTFGHSGFDKPKQTYGLGQQTENIEQQSGWFGKEPQYFHGALYHKQNGGLQLGSSMAKTENIEQANIQREQSPHYLSQQTDDLGQQTEDLGQQIEDLGKYTINTGQNTEDLGQQTEDLGQQTEDLGKYTIYTGLQTEDLGQQTEDLGQQTEDLGKYTIYTGQETEDLGQQTEDLGQQTQDVNKQSGWHGGNSKYVDDVFHKNQNGGLILGSSLSQTKKIDEDKTENDRSHHYLDQEDYLGQQTEDLGQQTEDLGQQTEDIGHQTGEIQQQTEYTNSQSEAHSRRVNYAYHQNQNNLQLGSKKFETQQNINGFQPKRSSPPQPPQYYGNLEQQTEDLGQQNENLEQIIQELSQHVVDNKQAYSHNEPGMQLGSILNENEHFGQQITKDYEHQDMDQPHGSLFVDYSAKERERSKQRGDILGESEPDQKLTHKHKDDFIDTEKVGSHLADILSMLENPGFDNGGHTVESKMEKIGKQHMPSPNEQKPKPYTNKLATGVDIEVDHKIGTDSYAPQVEQETQQLENWDNLFDGQEHEPKYKITQLQIESQTKPKTEPFPDQSNDNEKWSEQRSFLDHHPRQETDESDQQIQVKENLTGSVNQQTSNKEISFGGFEDYGQQKTMDENEDMQQQLLKENIQAENINVHSFDKDSSNNKQLQTQELDNLQHSQHVSNGQQHLDITKIDNKNELPLTTTERPGFWKRMGNNLEKSKDKVKSWFG